MADLIRGKIYDNIMQTMGNTPLVRFPRITEGVPADLCYKLEFFNPIASVKDRIAIAMIESLEESGDLKPGGTIVEPTSGNTCLLYTSPSPRDLSTSRMPSSA